MPPDSDKPEVYYYDDSEPGVDIACPACNQSMRIPEVALPFATGQFSAILCVECGNVIQVSYNRSVCSMSIEVYQLFAKANPEIDKQFAAAQKKIRMRQ